MIRKKKWYNGQSFHKLKNPEDTPNRRSYYAVLKTPERMQGEAVFVEPAEGLRIYPLTLQLVAELVYVSEGRKVAFPAKTILPDIEQVNQNYLVFVPQSNLPFVMAVQRRVSKMRDRSTSPSIRSTVESREKDGLPGDALVLAQEILKKRKRAAGSYS